MKGLPAMLDLRPPCCGRDELQTRSRSGFPCSGTKPQKAAAKDRHEKMVCILVLSTVPATLSLRFHTFGVSCIQNIFVIYENPYFLMQPKNRNQKSYAKFFCIALRKERETGLEPATPTLARSY
ncbi:MAG: hypothetical protein Q4D90_09775, partial [bacterium]|nr:hypothetical protein [bacterium]